MFNVSLPVNITNKTLSLVKYVPSIISYHSIPSLVVFFIILVLILAIVRVGVKIFGTFESFISRYAIPIIILAAMTLYVPYFSKVELPKMFVKTTFNSTLNRTVTVPNYDVIDSINKYSYAPPVYWDRVIYYGVENKVDQRCLLLPFLLLWTLYIYITFKLTNRFFELGSPIFALLLMLVFTAGGLGILHLFINFSDYPWLVSWWVCSMLFYYIVLFFKELFS